MKKNFTQLAALVGISVIIALVLAACNSPGAQNAGAKGGQVRVATVNAGKLAGDTVVAGKLEAVDTAQVVSKMSGRIASIPVEVGSQVSAGDTLLTLDAADLLALVELSAAQLDKARNSDLPSQLNQAELTLTRAETAFRATEVDYQRSVRLHEEAVISDQQFEQAQNQYSLDKAAYESAETGLDILVNATIPETIRNYEAQLNKAKADYANAFVYAPISGVVAVKNVNPGEMVSPSLPALTLVNLDRVMIQAGIDESQINQITTGMDLEVVVEAIRQEPFPGVVSNISPVADPATKTYPVQVRLENPQHELKPGMFAEVYINNNRAEGLIIPKSALCYEEDISFVWVLSDGKAFKRVVLAGSSDETNVVINDGLQEGEEVAISNMSDLQEGAEVNPQR